MVYGQNGFDGDIGEHIRPDPRLVISLEEGLVVVYFMGGCSL